MDHYSSIVGTTVSLSHKGQERIDVMSRQPHACTVAVPAQTQRGSDDNPRVYLHTIETIGLPKRVRFY